MPVKTTIRIKCVFVFGGMLASVACLSLLNQALRPRGAERPETELFSTADVGPHPSGAAKTSSGSERASCETPVTLSGAVSVMHGPEGAVLSTVLTVAGRDGWRDAAEYGIVLDEKGVELAQSMEWEIVRVVGGLVSRGGVESLLVASYEQVVQDAEEERAEDGEPAHSQTPATGLSDG